MLLLNFPLSLSYSIMLSTNIEVFFVAKWYPLTISLLVLETILKALYHFLIDFIPEHNIRDYTILVSCIGKQLSLCLGSLLCSSSFPSSVEQFREISILLKISNIYNTERILSAGLLLLLKIC